MTEKIMEYNYSLWMPKRMKEMILTLCQPNGFAEFIRDAIDEKIEREIEPKFNKSED